MPYPAGVTTRTVTVGGHIKVAAASGKRVYIGDTVGTPKTVVEGDALESSRLRAIPVATGDRPSAATAKAGAMIFDSTLGKPLWSNGSAWVDATGTPV